MFNPDNYPPVLLEALCLHSLYLKLGFRADDIFLGIAPDKITVRVIVSGRNFDAAVGKRPEMSDGNLKAVWKQLLKEWNTGGSMTPADKDKLFDSSATKRIQMRVALTLMRAGALPGWPSFLPPLDPGVN